MMTRQNSIRESKNRRDSRIKISVLLCLGLLTTAMVCLTGCVPENMWDEMDSSISPQSQEVTPISPAKGSVPFSLNQLAGSENELTSDNLATTTQDDPLAAARDNPIPASQESLILGTRNYMQNCEFCHGRHGRGDGPVGKKLIVLPTDLTSWSMQKRFAGGIYLAITSAPKGMPSFEQQLTDEERWDIVNFIFTEFAPEKAAPWTMEEYENTLDLGKHIFEEMRCEYCHVARRKKLHSDMPPTLEYSGSKFQKSWTVSYIKKAHRVRWDIPPNIWMPSFKLSDTETESLVSYLLTMKNEDKFPFIAYGEVPPEEQIARGRQLFSDYRCLGCHRLLGKGARVGPDLTHVGSKLRLEYMFPFIKHAKDIIPQTIMKDFALSDGDALALARYLETLK